MVRPKSTNKIPWVNPTTIRKVPHEESTRVWEKPWFVYGHMTAHPTAVACDWLM